MKNKGFIAILWLLVALAIPAVAQDQSGSVAIAGAIRPSMNDVTLEGLTKCAASFVEMGMKPKDAVKACTKLAEINAHTTTKVANEAADATKASRPVVVSNGYGGYNYGYSSYGYSRPVVRRPAIVRPPIVIPPRPPKKTAAVAAPATAPRSNAPARRSAPSVSRPNVSKK